MVAAFVVCLDGVVDVFEYWGVFDLELFLVERAGSPLGILLEGSLLLDVLEFLDDVDVRRLFGAESNFLAVCSSSAEL